MIDSPFRAILPRYTTPLVALYQRLGLTPNMISLGSLGIAILAAWFCAVGHAEAAIAAWWLGRLFDGTDGIYARATGQTSDFGAYLDILCDMSSYSLMVLGFFIHYPDLALAWVIMLLLYVLCIASALALGSLQEKRQLGLGDNRGLRLGAGLAEGGETGIAYTLFLLLPQYLLILVIAWLAVLGVTVAARSLLAYRILQPQN